MHGVLHDHEHHQIQATVETTLRRKAEACIDFRFCNVSKMMKTVKQGFIESAAVECNGAQWWMTLYPNGDGWAAKGYASCYLKCDAAKPLLASYSIALFHGETLKRQRGRKCNTVPASSRMGWTKFIPRAKLLNEDAAVFHACITIYEQEPESKTIYNTVSLPAPSCEGMPLPDPAFADVILTVRGERLPAHKCLLVPQSAFFKAMFQHPMKEAACNEVSIDDQFPVSAVKAMLHFVYTGSIPPQALADDAAQLMALASYYQIDTMKRCVEAFLIESMNTANVGKMLHTAHAFSCLDLQEAALQSIAVRPEAATSPAFLDSLELETSKLVIKAIAEHAADKETRQHQQQTIDELSSIDQCSDASSRNNMDEGTISFWAHH